MAIVTENITINGKQFVRTYSDAGRYVVGGSPEGEYAEAIEPAEFGRTYTEGDLIPQTDSDLADKAEAYDLLTGVTE